MKLLLLGGPRFLGRHLIESALARGHQVTTFNRGRANPDLYPEVEKVRGDRDSDLGALAGRRWDVAIDTSGYLPRVVRASAEALAGAVDRYTFISSLSVYPDTQTPGLDERAPVGTLADERVEEINGETYGPLKALCERAVEAALPGGTLVVRPGLIVGPHDPTDRFTYWPGRVARGGDVLAPGRPERAIQFIDVRDLAGWIVRMAEAGRTGVFNANGPERTLTMGEFLATCEAVAGADARFVWADDRFLIAAGVGPWMELPLWLPEAEAAGFFAFDSRKAIAAGLTFRPLAETVRDTLAWDRARPADTERRAGLAPERERELLRQLSEVTG